MERRNFIDRFNVGGRRRSYRGESPVKVLAIKETFCFQYPSHLYVGGSLS
jgi:hypothetical protein